MKRHLVVAGTGRAGTSFLVQYLTACGLETHITKNPGVKLDENANAGLEDLPDGQSDLPYVIKSPWLFEFIDRLLERNDIGIDAVILPIRDIIEAASSRITLEMRSRVEHLSIEEYSRWESWGGTAGGVVFSLNPLDQARLLAMGFHRVVHKLVENDIPIVFLDFRRFVTDGEYLYRQLAPVLSVDVTTALDAHRRTAKPDLVRVGREISAVPFDKVYLPDIEYPSHDSLDRNALFREIQKCRSLMQTLNQSHRVEMENSGREIEGLKQQAESLRSSLHASDHEMEQLRSSNATLNGKLMQLRESLAKAQSLERDYREKLTDVLDSHTWRMTKPVRAFLTTLKRIC